MRIFIASGARTSSRTASARSTDPRSRRPAAQPRTHRTRAAAVLLVGGAEAPDQLALFHRHYNEPDRQQRDQRERQDEPVRRDQAERDEQQHAGRVERMADPAIGPMRDELVRRLGEDGLADVGADRAQDPARRYDGGEAE